MVRLFRGSAAQKAAVPPSPAELRRQRVAERRAEIQKKLDEEEDLLYEEEEVQFLQTELREVRKLRHQHGPHS